MTRYTMFSGGEGSFRAALIDRANHPDAEHGLVFTDMLYEDADTYRFLIEAAAFALGRPVPNWLPQADDFPDYRVDADVPIEEYRGNAQWRAYLCSRIGKREVADAWRGEHCRRVGELFGPADHFAVGISVDEDHRFDDGKGGGLRPRYAADGWLYHAPQIEAEAAIRAGDHRHLRLLYAPVAELGVPGQRMYRQGYKHGNCGGFCIKAGMAHWANRYRVAPERYAYDAMMERKLGAFLGSPVSILTDRRGGTGKKPMTLEAFGRRLRAEPGRKYEYQRGESGCGCMVTAS